MEDFCNLILKEPKVLIHSTVFPTQMPGQSVLFSCSKGKNTEELVNFLSIEKPNHLEFISWD